MTSGGERLHKPRRVGLIGWGAIGQSILTHLGGRQPKSFRIAALLVRTGQLAQAQHLMGPEVLCTDDAARFSSVDLDLVVEAAGQAAVVQHAQAILERGLDVYVLSIGALADAGVRARLMQAAHSAGSRICVPCGALAAFDGLQALRVAGLTSVTYTSTKPPRAWQGTIAERTCSLDDIVKPVVIFRGSAGDAALAYPKNANLAAAVALAGLGFDATQVELVADPAATGNSGRIQAAGPTASLDLTLSGLGSENNPKTSEITAMSVISALENSTAALRFV